MSATKAPDRDGPGRRRGKPWQLAVLGVGLGFLGDVTANAVANDLGIGQQALVVAVVLLACGIPYLIHTRRPPTPPAVTGESGRTPALTDPLPRHEHLLGRQHLIDQAVERATQHGLVVVCGPSGSGVSAVAVEAARMVVPEAERQQYVDLRGQNPGRPDSPRWVAERVLSVLGERPGRTRLESAAEKVRQSLANTGRVLVLDNITNADQVSWLAEPVPGAYLVLAGSFPADSFAKQPTVPVGRLDAYSTRQLLLRQDTNDLPGRRVADRLDADPKAAQTLVEVFLLQPRIAIGVGRWLSANESVTVAQVVEELSRHDREPTALARFLLEQLLEGASRDAKRLRASLAQLPIATLSESAVAAMLGVRRDRAVALLDELIRHSLVEQSAVGRYRLQEPARSLAGTSDTLADAELQRLLVHYAILATRHVTALSGRDEVAEALRWFRLEDTALLELLGMPAPPNVAAEPLRWIADALDWWFAREGRTVDRAAAAQAMGQAAEALGDSGMTATARWRLTVTSASLGDLDDADQHYHGVDALGKATAEAGHGSASLHARRGQWHLIRGEADPALREFKESYDRRPRSDSVGRVTDLVNMGAALLHSGRDTEAEHVLRDAYGKAKETDDRAGEAHALELLGVAIYGQHQTAQARTRWYEAERLYEQVGDDVGQARCLLHTATARLAEHTRPRVDDDVVNTLRRSLELRGDGTTGTGVALTHLRLAECALSRSDTEQVRAHQQAGLEALRPWNNRQAEVSTIRDQLLALTQDPTGPGPTTV